MRIFCKAEEPPRPKPKRRGRGEPQKERPPATRTQPSERPGNAWRQSEAKGPPPDDGGFKPYAKHADKQLRYERYLICRKGGKRLALRYLQPADMTEWEREREVNEFERAAVLYTRRPTTSISSRFVSSSSNVQV